MSGAAANDAASAFDFAAHYPGLRRLFFVLGVQKASTTWLAEMLAQSEGCHVARGKELHYWSMIDRGGPGPADVALRRRQVREIAWDLLRSAGSPAQARANYGRLKVYWTVYQMAQDPSLARYARRLMQGWKGQPLAGELTPIYCLLSPETLARLVGLMPDVRFVMILRDPVQRFWSGIRHNYRGDTRAGRDVERDVMQDFQVALRDPASMHYRLSDYRTLVATLSAALPPDRIAYFFHETIREPGEMARLAAFLDLPGIRCDAGRMVNAGRQDGVRIPASAATEARKVFAPAYDFVEDHFAGQVPPAWAQPAEAA